MEAAPAAIPTNAVFKLGVGFERSPQLPLRLGGGTRLSRDSRRLLELESSEIDSSPLVPLRFSTLWLGLLTMVEISLKILGRREVVLSPFSASFLKKLPLMTPSVSTTLGILLRRVPHVAAYDTNESLL